DALQKARFVASFGAFLDDTTALADLVLPSSLPLERWGSAVPDLSPAPTLTLQQPILRPLYDTRGFADALLALGAGLGGEVARALPWRTLEEVLRESAVGLQRLGRGSVRETELGRFWNGMRQAGGWWDEPGTAGTS